MGSPTHARARCCRPRPASIQSGYGTRRRPCFAVRLRQHRGGIREMHAFAPEEVFPWFQSRTETMLWCGTDSFRIFWVRTESLQQHYRRRIHGSHACTHGKCIDCSIVRPMVRTAPCIRATKNIIGAASSSANFARAANGSAVWQHNTADHRWLLRDDQGSGGEA